MSASKCPTCGQDATFRDASGTYWDSSAHYWRDQPSQPVAVSPAREWLKENYNEHEGIGGVTCSDLGELVRTDILVELLEAYAKSLLSGEAIDQACKEAAKQLRGNGYLPDATNHEIAAAAIIRAAIEKAVTK